MLMWINVLYWTALALCVVCAGLNLYMCFKFIRSIRNYNLCRKAYEEALRDLVDAEK